MPDLTPASLKAWRTARKLTRAEASVLLGISPRTLESLEYGRAERGTLWGILGRLIDALDALDRNAA